MKPFMMDRIRSTAVLAPYRSLFEVYLDGAALYANHRWLERLYGTLFLVGQFVAIYHVLIIVTMRLYTWA